MIILLLENIMNNFGIVFLEECNEQCWINDQVISISA